jgi:excisionase family DNA binding protein
MYTTAQAAERAGLSKNTVLRWIADGLIHDVERDWRGWRVWSREDIGRLKSFKADYHEKPVPRTSRRLPPRPEYAGRFAESMLLFGDACAKRGRRRQ